MLFCIFPVQNRDFEETFNNVDYWFIEFNENIPIRETGFNAEKQEICKMPFQDNYGFWTDSNMQFSDFCNSASFEIDKISQKIFEEKWERECIIS